MMLNYVLLHTLGKAVNPRYELNKVCYDIQVRECLKQGTEDNTFHRFLAQWNLNIIILFYIIH